MRQNPHVRICGGPGSATTLVYPTAIRRGWCRALTPLYVKTLLQAAWMIS